MFQIKPSMQVRLKSRTSGDLIRKRQETDEAAAAMKLCSSCKRGAFLLPVAYCIYAGAGVMPLTRRFPQRFS